MLLDQQGNPIRPVPRLVDPVYDPRVEDAGYSLPAVRTDNVTPELREDLSRELETARMDAGVDRIRQANLDAFANELTGLGTVWGDKTKGGLQGGPIFCLTRIHGPEAEAMARGSDLGANVVNKIPDEMTREGWSIEVQPTEEESETSGDVRAQLDACLRDPRRAAAGWRREAWIRSRADAARCLAFASRWDAWPTQETAASPASAPPPPPGPLPKINDEGIEIARSMELWGESVGVERAVNQALRYERCFGGGAILIGVDDGQDDLTQPLDLSKVRNVTHLTPLSGGWDGEVVAWRPYNDPRKPKYGLPEVYQVRNLSVQLARPPAPGETKPPKQLVPMGPTGPTIFYVHESRFMIFDGEPTSRQVQQEMRGWGDSIFTRVKEVLVQFDTTWNAVASLMQEFSIINMAIDGYSTLLASKNPADRDILLKRARDLQLIRSVARMNVYDAKDKVERMNVSIAGVPELLDGPLARRLAAAADEPVSLLFGQVVGAIGGGAGEAERRSFYDSLRSKQNRKIVPQLRRLYDIVWHSKEGPTRGKVPERWSVVPRPLWQSTPSEQADVRLKTTQADQIEITQGVVTSEEVAAKRYGGAEYDSGPIVLDLEGRSKASAAAALAPKPKAKSPQMQLPGTGRAPKSTESGPPMRAMPSDPITGDPTSTPSEIGQTEKKGARGDQDGRPFDERLDEFARAAWTLDGHEDQPRDERGRWVGSGAAGEAVAKSIAEHLASKGIQAIHEGGRVKLSRGGTIEIGKRGERTYKGTTAKAQHAAEAHLSAGPKHVAAWATRTSPQAAKERMAAERAARAASPKVRAERDPKGRIDPAKVPGAGHGYRVVTTNSKDPEKGYKGRSFNCRSSDDMKHEFLAAGARGGGSNGHVVEREVGGTAAHEGGARDRSQWDAVREKYSGKVAGADKVETFNQAFKVLAQASAQAAGNRNGAPNWRHFDIAALRGCRGMEHTEVPGWVHEAEANRQEAEHFASYYDNHGGEGGEGEGGGGAPPDDVPF